MKQASKRFFFEKKQQETFDGAARAGRAATASRRSVIAGALTLPFISRAEAADKLTLRLDFTASGLHAPFYLATKKGWFDRAAIDLAMEDGNGSAATVQFVGAGSFDLGLNALGPVAVARAKGVPITSVAGFVRKSELGFLVPADSGWTTPKDLVGKRIIYNTTSQEGPFVRSFLKQNGVAEDQVELVNVDGASRYAVYFAKKADALLTTVPGVMPIAAKQRPSTAILLSDFGWNIPGLGISVRPDTLAKKHDTIERFVSVVCGAWTYLLDGHDQEGGDAVFANRPSGAFTAAMMAEQIRLFKPFFFTDATKGMPIGMQSELDWKLALTSMEEAQLLKPGSKPTDYFTNDCIDRAIIDKVAADAY